jgi:hypothetical protein
MSIAAGSAVSPAYGSKGYQNLRVGSVDGGSDTSAIGLSDVSNDALRTALTTSLRNLGYLAADPSKAGYVLSVDIVDLDRPVVAIDPAFIFVPVDMSVTVTLHYTLAAAARQGRPIVDETVATTGTASAADALTPAGRVRKANEAGVRLNTAEFLKRLNASWK